MTRSFDGPDQLPLMFCTGSGNPFGNDFALFRDKTIQFLLILVVDINLLRVAETAGAFLPHCVGIALFAAVVASASILALMKHGRISFLKMFFKSRKIRHNFLVVINFTRRQCRLTRGPPVRFSPPPLQRVLWLLAPSCPIESSDGG